MRLPRSCLSVDLGHHAGANSAAERLVQLGTAETQQLLSGPQLGGRLHPSSQHGAGDLRQRRIALSPRLPFLSAAPAKQFIARLRDVIVGEHRRMKTERGLQSHRLQQNSDSQNLQDWTRQFRCEGLTHRFRIAR